jgi:hypothetical protein
MLGNQHSHALVLSFISSFLFLHSPSEKFWYYDTDGPKKTAETQKDGRSRTSRLYATRAEARQGLSGADGA